MNDNIFNDVSTYDLQDINGALSYLISLQHERCPPNTTCQQDKNSNCLKCWHEYIGQVVMFRKSKIHKE